MGHLGRATCTLHSISSQTSQEVIECTKANEWLRAYCPNIYIYCANSVSPPHGDLHLIFIDDQIGSGENVWDDTCLPPEFSLA